ERENPGKIVRPLDTRNGAPCREGDKLLRVLSRVGVWLARHRAGRSGQTWSDGVDGDSVTTELAGQRTGQPDDGPFTRCVMAQPADNDAEGGRRLVGDASRTVGPHRS